MIFPKMPDPMEVVKGAFDRLRNKQRAESSRLSEERGLDTKGLNPHLVAKQKLTQEDIDAVTEEHLVKDKLFERMRKLDPVGQRQELQLCALELEQIEFAMQRAWKFEEDANMHSWWYNAPHCKCPWMDNRDPLMPNKIKQQDCPLHGWAEGETPPPSELDA